MIQRAVFTTFFFIFDNDKLERLLKWLIIFCFQILWDDGKPHLRRQRRSTAVVSQRQRRSWSQSHKTSYNRNLRCFVISWSVCPWRAFPTQSNACRYGQEPTLEWSTSWVLYSGRLRSYLPNKLARDKGSSLVSGEEEKKFYETVVGRSWSGRRRVFVDSDVRRRRF